MAISVPQRIVQCLPSSLKWGQKRKLHLVNLLLSWQPQPAYAEENLAAASETLALFRGLYPARTISDICYWTIFAKSKPYCHVVFSVRVHFFFFPLAGSKWASLQCLFHFSFVQLRLNLSHFLSIWLHGYFSLFLSWTTLVQLLFNCHLAFVASHQYIFLPVSQPTASNFPCYRRTIKPVLSLTSKVFTLSVCNYKVKFFPKAIQFLRTPVGFWIDICS